MFYENSTGNISVLMRTVDPAPDYISQSPEFDYLDVTFSQSEMGDPWSDLRAPFASLANWGPDIGVMFFSGPNTSSVDSGGAETFFTIYCDTETNSSVEFDEGMHCASSYPEPLFII